MERTETSGWDGDLIYTATRSGRKAHISIGAGSTFCGSRVAIRVAARQIDAGHYSVCETCQRAIDSLNRRAAEHGRDGVTIANKERNTK